MRVDLETVSSLLDEMEDHVTECRDELREDASSESRRIILYHVAQMNLVIKHLLTEVRESLLDEAEVARRPR